MLTALALIASGALAGSTLSWWLTVRIEPSDALYRGVPVSQLSVPLLFLSPLSCDPCSDQFTTSQCAEIKSNGAHFQVIGDFNDDGEQEIAQTGVAQLLNGHLVRILIVSNQRNPRKNQVFVLPGNGFSAIYPGPDGALSWNDCMECGHAVEIVWDSTRSTYVAVVPESYGAEPFNNPIKPTKPTYRTFHWPIFSAGQ